MSTSTVEPTGELVIDLRESAPPAPAPTGAAVPAPTPRDDPAPPSSDRSFGRADVERWAKRVVAVVVVGLALGTVYELFVTDVIYARRQDHLAAGFSGPRRQFLPGHGDGVAVLQIPSIGLDLVVVEGDEPADLRGGPGHRMGTPIPGEVGNSVILGHESRYGGPFGDLDELEVGAEVFAQSKAQSTAVRYVVDRIEESDEAESDLLGPTDDERLTLVTSGSGRFTDHHLLIVATRDSERGTPIVRGGEPAADDPAATAADSPAAADPPAADPAAEVAEPELAFDAHGVGSVGNLAWPAVCATVALFVVALGAEARRRYPLGVVVAISTGPVLLLALAFAFSMDRVFGSTL
jgi:LPXTG-site transpeptidase (sortase) family protein